MLVGNKKYSPVYTGNNYKEIVNSFPFYLTRDDQVEIRDNNYLSIKRSNGKPNICSGQDAETKAVHFFTNIGVLNLSVGERLEYVDIE